LHQIKLWRRTADIDRRSISITSWNGITEPSNALVRVNQHFRSFWGVRRTIAGYEAIDMIRKGWACGSATAARVGLLHRFIVGMFAIEV
jgi:hypothetical protein